MILTYATIVSSSMKSSGGDSNVGKHVPRTDRGPARKGPGRINKLRLFLDCDVTHDQDGELPLLPTGSHLNEDTNGRAPCRRSSLCTFSTSSRRFPER